MKKDTKEKQFIISPIFEGGSKGIKAFVQKNIQYPKEAQIAKIEGIKGLS